jgi:hypothetical protein
MTIRFAFIAAVVGSTLNATSTLLAQELRPAAGKTARWELLVPSGALVPTGSQRDAIKTANLSAVQLTLVAQPAFAITSTVGWARSRDIASTGNPKLDVFSYDLGAEIRGHRWLGGKAMTFAGAGVGGRSYNYRKLDVDATHNVAAYASAGSELAARRLRVRIEARDYVSGFKPLAGPGAARTGNDVVVMAGLRIVSR